MKPTTLAFAIALASLLSPAAAMAGGGTLAQLLPSFTFPEDTVTPSTKGCVAEGTAPTCVHQE